MKLQGTKTWTYGSAISRSVSLTILLGKAAVMVRDLTLIETGRTGRLGADVFVKRTVCVALLVKVLKRKLLEDGLDFLRD